MRRTAMRRNSVRGKVRTATLLVLAAFLVPAATPPASAQDTEDSTALRAGRGRTSYRLYCRNCHGKEGKGDGPIAELLKVQPADLTVLAAEAGGEFPADRVYETIDGRNDVRAHGSREMPIWGLSFQDPSRTDDQEEEVRERILDLVEYIRSLQPASSSLDANARSTDTDTATPVGRPTSTP